MVFIYILLFIAVVLALAYFCCRAGFYVPAQTEVDLFKFPSSEQYAPYADEMPKMVQAALDIPYEDVWIRSHDGLRLHGKFYAATPDAPVQIMFHGYKSGAERDFCGGDDRFVPCRMSKENYEHCAAENKRLLIVSDAGHGISYMLDREAYLAALDEFSKSVL